ncbi:MAG: copper transporter [Thermoanaerobacteraceae bacterium]|nr:copper transporter [Thermoanaerobacteraceae bacterium]
MFDLRYHITTLVAVFLALAIGILVGTTMVSDQALVEQQQQIIDRLESDFAALRERTRESQQEMSVFKTATDNYRQFARQVYPLVVSSRLQGIQAALLITGEADYTDLVSNLSVSGLEIHPVIGVNKHGLVDNEGMVSDPVQVKILAKQLAAYLISGVQTELLKKWEQAGLYKVYQRSDTEPAVVIVVGGSNNDSDVAWIKHFDIPLIKELKEYEKVIVGTEYSQVAFSYVKYYQMEGISTVDNIDTILGQTALAFLLEGRPGHYGVKPTAQSVLPQLD